MKKIILGALALFSLVLLDSCTSTSDTKAPEESVVEGTYFKYNSDSTSVNWTAFKTHELIGVSGSFTEFTITGTDSATSVLDVIKNASISIPITGIFSKNEGRDERIRDFFFGKMADTESLLGTVKELKEDGTGVLTLTMNDVTNDVPVEVLIEGTKVEFTTTINLENWQAQTAVEALNEECGDLHAGSDGVSFLSPDVKIVITSILDAVK